MPNSRRSLAAASMVLRLAWLCTLTAACTTGTPPRIAGDAAQMPDAMDAVDADASADDASSTGDATSSEDASAESGPDPMDSGVSPVDAASPSDASLEADAGSDAGVAPCAFDTTGSGVWEPRPFPATTHPISDVVFDSNGDAYAAVFQEGIYKAHAPCYDDFARIYDAPTGGWRRLVRTASGVLIATGAHGNGLTAQVARSVDGETFEDITSRLPRPDKGIPSSFYSAAYNAETDVVFVGAGWLFGENILYRSLDSGESWSFAARTPAHDDAVTRIATGVVAGPGSRVAVGTEGAGLWVSYDDGVTFPGWIAMPDPKYQGRESRVGPNGLFYVSIDNDAGGHGGLYRGNAEYAALTSFDELPLPPGLTPMPAAAHWAAQVIAYGFIGDVLFVVAARAGQGRAIALSYDFGATFVDYASGYATTTPNGIVLGPDGHAYAFGVNGAFYRTRASFP